MRMKKRRSKVVSCLGNISNVFVLFISFFLQWVTLNRIYSNSIEKLFTYNKSYRENDKSIQSSQMCMHACVHVCMCACMHVFVFARVRICMFTCVTVLCVCVFAIMHLCMCAGLCVFQHVWIYLYVYIIFARTFVLFIMCVFLFSCMYVHTHVCTQKVCACLYVYMYPWVVHACPSPTCRHASACLYIRKHVLIETAGAHSPVHALLLMAKCSIPALTVRFVHNSDKKMRVLWLSKASLTVECCRSTFSSREGLESEKVCGRWAVCLCTWAYIWLHRHERACSHTCTHTTHTHTHTHTEREREREREKERETDGQCHTQHTHTHTHTHRHTQFFSFSYQSHWPTGSKAIVKGSHFKETRKLDLENEGMPPPQSRTKPSRKWRN